MRHLDLFSGIGGFSLAAQWVWGEDHEIVCFVEQDTFCQKVLRKHWPGVPIVEDVRDVNQIMAHTNWQRFKEQQICVSTRDKKEGDEISRGGAPVTTEGVKWGEYHQPPTIDLLTGGFPCQGFSVAGKQRGKEDERYLWPEMLEVIKAVRPRWVIGENVAGIINMALDTVLSDLEIEGYATQAFVIPACSQNAPHRRDRVWIVADTSAQGLQEPTLPGFRSVQQSETSLKRGQFSGRSSEAGGNWAVEPDVGRVAYGVPNRVDRLKSLGNAIVPQVVMPIMQAIKEIRGRG